MAGQAGSDGSRPASTTTRKRSPTRAAPRKAATAAKVPGRAAMEKVDEAAHLRLDLPVLGSVRLPEPQQLTYYAAIGALGVIGALEWPVVLVLGAGHALATSQHHRVLQQFGEALEDA